MALPSLDKTWVFPSVNATGSGVTAKQCHQNLLLDIKNSIAGAWPSVAGSSDATNAGMDAIDRWTVANDLTWAAPGVAHSWIVLDTPLGGQLCFDCTPLDSGVEGPRLTVAYSESGAFAGGSTSNRPTAVDEIVMLNGGQWIGTTAASGTFNYVFHHMRDSVQEQAERIIIHIGGVCVGFLFLDLVPQNPVAGWATPSIVGYVGATNLSTNQLTYQRLWSAAAFKGREAGVVGDIVMTSEGFNGVGAGQALTTANDFTLAWPFFSIAFASQTVGMRGRLTGMNPVQRGCWDLWFGSTTISEGSTYPAAGTNDFVQFGHLIFPWDGSVPVTA